MSEKLKTMREGECLDDSYGLDGDGLCEGEVACEEEITWPFLPSWSIGWGGDQTYGSRKDAKVRAWEWIPWGSKARTERD